MSTSAYHDMAKRYGGAWRSKHQQDHVDGGDCCGGDDDLALRDKMSTSELRDYATSLNSYVKDAVADDIIEIMESIGLRSDKESREEKIADIAKKIPHKSSKSQFKVDKDAHEKICLKIADAINKKYGDLIDKTLPAEVVCQKVHDFVVSLKAGMHVEFVGVYNELRRVMKNLQMLNGQLTDVFEPLVKALAQSDDIKLKEKAVRYMDVHKIISKHIDQQMAMLGNLLNLTISPAEASLAAMIKHDKDIVATLDKAKAAPGSSVFSDYLSNVLLSLKDTPAFALLIDKALKNVGITIDEYASGDMKHLMDKMADIVARKDVDNKQLHDIITSWNLLYKNFSRSKDIAKLLHTMDNKSGAGDDTLGGAIPTSSGISSEDSSGPLTNMDKRIRNRREALKIILDVFDRRIRKQFENINQAVSSIAPKFGDGIPRSDQLDALIKAFDRLDPILTQQNAVLILSGYYNDASSRMLREEFAAQLKSILGHLEAVQNMNAYAKHSADLKEIADSIKLMLSMVSKLADTIAEKFGGNEENPAPVDGAEDEALGGDDGCIGGDDPMHILPKSSVVFRTFLNFKDSIRKLKYYYKSAQIRDNLRNMEAENQAFAEKYEELRAISVAKKLQALNDWKEYMINGGGPNNVGALKNNPYIVSLPENVRQQTIDAVSKYVDKTAEGRKRFWRTVEAVDEYMRVFTNGLIKDPNATRDLKSILDSTEDISDWYNESLGNEISAVFDSFPGTRVGVRDTAPDASYRDVTAPAHYYSKIAAVANTGNVARIPGNPYLAVDISVGIETGVEAKAHAKKAVTHLFAIKNIVALFTYIGSKFAGEEIRKKTFMSPTQIYKNLCEHIENSSFGIGCVVRDNVGVDFANRMMIRPLPGGHGVYPQLVGGAPPTDSIVGFGNVIGVPATPQEQAQVAFRRQYGVYMRSCNIKPLTGTNLEQDEDGFFVLVIKSMAAKVLTILGLQTMFERPYERQFYSPIRMILGGDDSTPKVEPDAIELYLRLPLLAEFYRDLFGFNKSEPPSQDFIPGNADDSEKLTLLPEVDGVFGGLIRLMFRKARGIQLVNFSDSDLKELIGEINAIYAKYASEGDSIVSKVVKAFVDEMNRRYGLMKKRDRDNWEKEFGERYGYRQYNQLGDRLPRDIAILPGEADADFERDAVAPSDKFVQGKRLGDVDLLKDSPVEIKRAHQQLFMRFRCMLDNYFRQNVGGVNPMNVPIDVTQETDFRPAIKAVSAQLKTETNAEARLKLIGGLIRNYTGYYRGDGHKYVMFHECVIAPLNIIGAIYTILDTFRDLGAALDIRNIEAVANATNEALMLQYIPMYNFRGGAKPQFNTLLSTFWRGGFKPEPVIKEVVRTIGSICNDLGGLVSVDISADRININFGQLRNAVEEMLAEVRYFADLLRPHIEKPLFDRYIDKMETGSFYWFQENIVDKIFVGREGTHSVNYALSPDHIKTQYLNLEKISANINDGLNRAFTALSATNGIGDFFAGLLFYDYSKAHSGLQDTFHVTAQTPSQFVNYRVGLNKLLHKALGEEKYMFYPNFSNRYLQLYSWDVETPSFARHGSLLTNFNQLLAKYLAHTFDHASEKMYEGLLGHIVNGPLNNFIMIPGSAYPDTIKSLADDADPSLDVTVIDHPPGVRTNVGSAGRIQAAAPGGWILNNQVITEPYLLAVIPPHHVANALFSFGRRADPKQDAVIYASLAQIIKNIFTSKDTKKGDLIYLAKSLGEISGYSKEKLKGLLPFYRLKFLELIKQAEMLKQFIAMGADAGKMGRSAFPADGVSIDQTPGFQGSGIISSVDQRALSTNPVQCARSYMSFASNISKACQSVVNAIEQVYRELADVPKIGELSTNFIADYKQLYHREPIMLMSNALLALDHGRDVVGSAGTIVTHTEMDPFSPVYGIGKPEFKILYSVRQLLGMPDQQIKLENALGFTNVVNNYNLGVDERDRADKSHQERFLGAYAKLLRFAHEANIKHRLLIARDAKLPVEWVYVNHHNRYVRSNIAHYVIYGEGVMGDPPKCVIQLVRPIPDILDISENSFQDRKIKEIVDYLYAGRGVSPIDAKIQNIIDMNIVPINVHALMRDIPLVNLYNYSYTFDRMLVEIVYDIFGPSASGILDAYCQNANGVVDGNDVDIKMGRLTSAKDLFVALLVNPFRSLFSPTDQQLLAQLFGGHTQLPMGRSRFLSDQLYGKALFGGPSDDNQTADRPDYTRPGPGPFTVPGTMSQLKYVAPASGQHKDHNDSETVGVNQRVNPGTRRAANAAHIEIVPVAQDLRVVLNLLQQLRTDTVFVRNLMFIVNLYRVLRHKLYADSSYMQSPIMRGAQLSRWQNTEYRGYQTYETPEWERETGI